MNINQFSKKVKKGQVLFCGIFVFLRIKNSKTYENCICPFFIFTVFLLSILLYKIFRI